MSVISTRQEPPRIVRSAAAGRRPPSGPPGGGFTAADILRVLRKRKWLILITLAAALALSAGGTFIWWRYAPMYQARALLMVRPRKGSIYRETTWITNPDIMEQMMRTQAGLVLSYDVLLAACRDPKMRETKWFKGILEKDREGAAIEQLQMELDVQPMPKTAYIQISMSGLDREDLPEIINIVAEHAEKISTEGTKGQHEQEITNLTDQMNALIKTRDTRLREAKDARKSAKEGGLTTSQLALTEELRAINESIRELRLEQSRITEFLRSLQDLDLENPDTDELMKIGLVQTFVDTHPNVQGLRNALVTLRSQLVSLSKKLGEKHRNVTAIRDRIDGLVAELEREKATLAVQGAQNLLSRNRMDAAYIKAALNKLGDDQEDVQAKLRDVTGALEEIKLKEEEAKRLDEQIQRMNQRILDLQVIRKSDVPMHVAQKAVTPRRPYMPRWGVMLPAGLALGLFLGLALAFLLEFIDTSVKSPSDVARRVELPVLGMVPHVDDVEEEIADIRLVAINNPSSLISEAYRQIRTNLLFSGPEERRRCLVVTSPAPADGRTSVALNLGATIAAGGHKVLVADANFRQPCLRRLFPQCPEGGLSSALVGQADWRDQVTETEPGLYVMASGPLPPNPAELLGSDQMRQLIQEASTEFDQMIFDGPPCLVVTDPCVLSALTDGVVLVVRAGVNTYGVVRRTRDMLTRVGVHIVGAVLNGVRVTAGGYFRKSYEVFYEYQERAQLPAESSV
jgi:capsular exopolysaccharide synthesis family protein